MTGWRIGFALGNAELITALGRVKTNLDSGVFQAVQYAGIEALEKEDDHILKMREIYQRRRDLFVTGLRQLGWQVEPNPATFYLWVKCPDGTDSRQVSKTFLEKAGVVITPGVGFGQYGEGYVRMTLTVSEERLEEVLNRIRNLNF